MNQRFYPNTQILKAVTYSTIQPELRRAMELSRVQLGYRPIEVERIDASEARYPLVGGIDNAVEWAKQRANDAWRANISGASLGLQVGLEQIGRDHLDSNTEITEDNAGIIVAAHLIEHDLPGTADYTVFTRVPITVQYYKAAKKDLTDKKGLSEVHPDVVKARKGNRYTLQEVYQTLLENIKKASGEEIHFRTGAVVR